MDTAQHSTPQLGFTSDNIAGASPEVIAAIAGCSTGQAQPYGADDTTRRVEEKLSALFETENGLNHTTGPTAPG